VTAWVIDSSVAVKWYVPEDHQEEALRILDLARSGEAEFHIPDLIHCEVASILWKKVRLGELSEREADEISLTFVDVPKTSHSSAMLMQSALKIACLSGRSTYDCFYLALAEFVGGRFITADKRLFNGLAGTIWRQSVVSLQSF
jgi:predicted nucleic acid-binding protein